MELALAFNTSLKLAQWIDCSTRIDVSVKTMFACWVLVVMQKVLYIFLLYYL